MALRAPVSGDAGKVGMQAIDRVMSILDAVTTRPEGATATEVAESTDLSLSTVTRLLHQLAARDLVSRTNSDRRYIMGPRLFGLVRKASSQVDLAALARPVLQRVRDETGETASLHVRRGNSRVCVAAMVSPQAVARHVPIGMAMPLHRNATGEVLLAGAPADERSRYIAELRLPPREETALRRRLEQIRNDGWAIVVDDWVPGVTGISAAVADGDLTVAALSVSGPATRFDAAAAQECVAVMLSVTRELSQWAAGAIR